MVENYWFFNLILVKWTKEKRKKKKREKEERKEKNCGVPNGRQNKSKAGSFVMRGLYPQLIYPPIIALFKCFLNKAGFYQTAIC